MLMFNTKEQKYVFARAMYPGIQTKADRTQGQRRGLCPCSKKKKCLQSLCFCPFPNPGGGSLSQSVILTLTDSILQGKHTVIYCISPDNIFTIFTWRVPPCCAVRFDKLLVLHQTNSKAKKRSNNNIV